MKNVKRILAIICIVVLVGMYVTAFVMAILDRSETMAMFKGCVALTIFIPIVAYCYIALHRYAMYRSGRSDSYSVNGAGSSKPDNVSSDDKPE